MILFLGDSITQGQNVDKTERFSNYFDDMFNAGISGTTIGEYSIYPVDGRSLVGATKILTNDISRADCIVIEYGINDTSAVLCGFATEQQVIVSFVKALDAIKQLNPRAEIYFLSLSNNNDIISMFAESQCKYLKEDYFKGYNFYIPSNLWYNTYKNIVSAISKRVDVIPMFDTLDWEAEISDDNLHPNVLGHKNIADNIMRYI